MPDYIEISIDNFFEGTAKLADASLYIQKILNIAGEGNDLVLTGRAPVWLYLKTAHALHGKAKSLRYKSPVTGLIEIFNHNPF